MITDTSMKKIKLDPELNCELALVKQDEESGEERMQSGNMEAGDETVEVVEEANPEGMEVEGVEVVTVEVKVDLSNEDESYSSVDASSLQNVVLTIKSLQNENQNLKTILGLTDAENVKLQALLKKEQLQNQVLSDERSEAKAELQKVTEKLKTEMDQRDAEMEDLKTQLKQRDLENKILSEQRSQAEKELESLKEFVSEKDKELASQNETIRSLQLQQEKMTELLAEKNAEVKSEAETSQSLRFQITKMKGASDTKICEARKALREDSLKEWNRNKEQVTDEQSTTGSCLPSEEPVLQRFQDVLKIFIRHQRQQSGLIIWRELLPIFKTCRLVCKSWKESVDFILQHDSSHVTLCDSRKAKLRFDGRFIPLPLLFSTGNTQINNPNKSALDLQKFLLHSERMPPGYNPVPSRHIIISQDFSCWMDTSRWQIVSKYLQQFGHQVWYLTVGISVGNTVTSLEITLRSLGEMLELVPNIRSLALCIITGSNGVADNVRLKQPSFPHLKHLETFIYCGNYDLYNRILATNQHILRMEFSEYSFRNIAFTKTGRKDLAFPNLSHVSLYGRSEDRKRKNNLKLEKLRLDCCKTSQSDSVEDMIRSLQKVDTTLKFLTLDLPHADESMLAVGKVNLPLLTDLHIISREWAPTNWESFLVQLESLESFSLQHVLDKPPTITEKKTYVEYVNNFRGKTDWMKMFKLKLVTLTVVIRRKSYRHLVGEAFQVTEKRAKNDVLRFNLVNIDEKEIVKYFCVDICPV